MSFAFNSTVLPHRESAEPFGLVQTGLSIDDDGSKCEFESTLSVCSRCSGYKFPCKNGKMECPMCSPESDFKDNIVCVDSGLARRNVYFLVIDLALPIATTRSLVSNFGKALEDTDTAMVIAVYGQKSVILYVENGMVLFGFVEQPRPLTPTHECSKNDIITLIEPCLPALYSLLVYPVESPLVDVLFPIELAMNQAAKRPFAIFFFLGSQTTQMTVQKVAAVSKDIEQRDGIVHFGATEHFKRLTAITHHSMGCVFGLSEFVPSTFRKLMSASRRVSMFLYCPRYVEIVKVTGSDGSIRSNSLLTILELERICGGSVKMRVDFGRIDKIPEKVRFLQITTTVSGKYARLHTFTFADTVESFRQAIDTDITRNLALKGYASDILRAVWAGASLEDAVKRVSGEYEVAVKGSIVEGLGEKPDRDALRLYYVLECMCTDMESKIVKTEKGTIFMVPPVAYVISTGDPVTEAEREIESEWPFEVRVFTDINAFKLLVEKFGKRLE